MKRLSQALLLALIIFSGGCTMAPKYTRPAATVPVDWPEGPAYAERPASSAFLSAADLSPQEFFLDPRLQQVINLALENNLDLRLAVLNVEKARAFYKIQQADLYPAISASAHGYKHRTSADLSSSDAPSTSEEYGIDVGITAWEIDLFGRVRSEKNQAIEKYLASDAGRRAAQISLVSAVGSAYLALAAAREQLLLAQSTLESQEEFYGIIEKQYQNGLATKLDLRRAQTTVNLAQRDVAQYQQWGAQGENALNLLVGSPVPAELLPERLSKVSLPRDFQMGLSSSVLLSRPDIMAAEHQLKAANAYIGVARAAFFPRISLTSLIGTASKGISGLFDSGSETWTLNPMIGIPLFDARAFLALQFTHTDQEIALTQYQKAIQTAFKEVADAFAVEGTIDQQVAAQESLVEATEEIYRLAQKRYTGGIESYLSVLDAQRSLYGSQQGLVGLRLAKLTNQVQLYAVLGGGNGAGR
ncbi:MAG: efflux transporter outer membrane subunit [Candidatus Eisenbacteria bacterium]|uniref:Efflux transporter outer membrane subunit n=1 Tax=Eiseniibacteriota bacterium TaxID=2212470 RepID=A0A948RRY9_UNCEI|nr:efflux transporter outer membrane subunit [Candidatus Eisenbacteria bacterium]MBU1951044.1 efflux transporter outer membrane subunit [Candidatus Eisenbacteria bacterium]MBU2689775.1 efflux transporter outer membrane subunit [Candidatus Eisenbacteria bacterium]